MIKKVIVAFALMLSFQSASAQIDLLKDFPKGYEPEVIGKRMAYHFVGANICCM